MPVLGAVRMDSILVGLWSKAPMTGQTLPATERKYQYLPVRDQDACFLEGLGYDKFLQGRETTVRRPGPELEKKSSTLKKPRHREGQRIPQNTQHNNSLPGPGLPDSGRMNWQMAMDTQIQVDYSRTSERPASVSPTPSLEEVGHPDPEH